MPVAARLMSLWSGDLTVLPAASNSLCWRLRNSTPWKLTSFHIQEALETSTPMGRAMLTIIAVTAELERDVIRERTTAGFEYARYHRTKSGKPIGRPRAVFSAGPSASTARRRSFRTGNRSQAGRVGGDGTPSLERPRTPPRGAKTPQRGHYEEPGTNPDRGGAEGLVNVGRLGVLNPGTYFSQLGLSGQL